MLALTFAEIDMTVILSAMFVAIPATIAAWSSLTNGRAMKTNHGKRPGEYLEEGAIAAVETHSRIGDLEHALTAHMVSDNENFTQIRQMLEAQNILSAKRAAPFLDQAHPASTQEEITP